MASTLESIASSYDTEVRNKALDKFNKEEGKNYDFSYDFSDPYEKHSNRQRELWTKCLHEAQDETTNETKNGSSDTVNSKSGKGAKKQQNEAKPSEGKKQLPKPQAKENCPNGSDHQKQDPDHKNCTFDDLKIVLPKYNKHTIALNTFSDSSQNFEILADDKSRLMNLKLLGIKSGKNCSHNHKLDNVFIAFDSEIIKQKNKTQSSCDLDIKTIYTPAQGTEIDSLLLDCKPEKVPVRVYTCGNNKEFSLSVYPQYSYHLDFTLDFGTEKKTFRELFNDLKSGKPRDPIINFSGNLGSTKIPLSREAELAQKYSGYLRDVFGYFAEWSDVNIGPVKISFTLPSIIVSGDWYYEETDSWQVKKAGILKIDANPLLAIDFKLDLIKAGLTLVGLAWVKTLLDEINDKAGGVVKIKVEAYLFANSKVTCKYTHDFSSSSNEPDKNITIGSLEIGLSIEAEGKLNVIIVKVHAKASMDATAKFRIQAIVKKIVPPTIYTDGVFDGLDVTIKGSVKVGILGKKVVDEKAEKIVPLMDDRTLFSKTLYLGGQS